MSKDHFAQDYFGESRRSEVLCKMVRTHFVSLIGSEVDYYGADEGDNTFKVDGVVFKVLEDPDDGYRSYMGAINYSEDHSSIFFRSPIARVRVEEYDLTHSHESCNGYRLVDVEDDHIWLEFGTDNYDDYYPMFIFRHSPKIGNGRVDINKCAVP
jgi:hypothetical protein